MVYLQSEDDLTDKVFEYKKEEYRLQVNDILDIQVRSMNDEANKLFLFKHKVETVAQAGIQSGGDLYYMTGYTVDQNGNIQLPFMDTVHVLGLTLKEAQFAIDEKVSNLFKNYFLQVKLEVFVLVPLANLIMQKTSYTSKSSDNL